MGTGTGMRGTSLRNHGTGHRLRRQIVLSSQSTGWPGPNSRMSGAERGQEWEGRSGRERSIQYRRYPTVKVLFIRLSFRGFT